MKNIQTNLLSAFESSGLTYDELAKRTNLPKSALYRYINGDTEKIPIDRFQAICREIDVDARSLLGWHEDHPEPPDIPRTPEARILATGIDKMPQAQREAIISMMQGLYPGLFEKGNDDHDA